jgi:DNA-binding NarL/FixJ family response regulator
MHDSAIFFYQQSLELDNRKKDLNNVVTNLSFKRKFISETQEKFKVLKQQPKEELLPNLSKLIREFDSYGIADKSLEVFQSDFEKVNLTFFKTLGEKFPLLTENEKEVCGLIVLKLSSKDIASIRNITPNAVKKHAKKSGKNSR